MTGPYFINRGKIPEVNGGSTHQSAGKITSQLNAVPANSVQYVEVKIGPRPAIIMPEPAAEALQKKLGQDRVKIIKVKRP